MIRLTFACFIPRLLAARHVIAFPFITYITGHNWTELQIAAIETHFTSIFLPAVRRKFYYSSGKKESPVDSIIYLLIFNFVALALTIKRLYKMWNILEIARILFNIYH